CYGDRDGMIVIDTIVGAKSPYSLSIDGENFFSFSSFPIVWPNLESGFYDITLIDANDFMVTFELLVPAPNDNQLDLGPDTLIQLGESILLQSAVNFFPDQILWTPSDFLDCDSCLNVQVTPIETTLYTVVAIDSLGCEVVDQIQVLVQKDRDLFVPNGFSPNNDGVNDKLIIFAGPDVRQIRRFQVFNRWGALVHNRLAFQPNDPTYGWDGLFNGQILDPDVFVYYVEVEFIDGAIEILKGDVVLLR
ncbi:MAG: gliding motility-associated C-terminal domain-containing protein, partial [Phaeodactylibacter sp.]|nr:gliding motility-associated C-terminal domain-containing protein [Phaeodactylibacter sp.]